MLETKPILQLGNPILRKSAAPIEFPLLTEKRELIEEMILTTDAMKGVGLAAPQLGVSSQLLILASRPNKRYPHAPLMEPKALLNPKIMLTSQDTVKDWEGCLSVPGLRGLVPRKRWVEVSYQDLEGQEIQERLHDFVARIFQHEYDHLIGKIFLDHLESTLDLMTEQEFQQRIQNAN